MCLGEVRGGREGDTRVSTYLTGGAGRSGAGGERMDRLLVGC